MRSRFLLALLVGLLAVAALPAAGLAQTAGQIEYGGVAAASETSPPATAGTTAGTTAGAGVLGETAESDPGASGSGAAGESTGSGSGTAPSGSAAQVAADTSDGTLPFTGRDLLLMLVAGLGLVGIGVALRTATRQSPAGA
ncbi:MAG TPA: hypothetical protein VMY78_09685 [Solirubrobacteraceae bacterium]|nr:hypothetical protein [Solirubrobacteraceae bacterium]